VIDPVRHQISGELVEAGTLFEGKIVEVLKPGIVDSEGNVIRRSLVVGGKAKAADEEKLKELEAKTLEAEKLLDEESEKLKLEEEVAAELTPEEE
jgi:hypothetical protein